MDELLRHLKWGDLIYSERLDKKRTLVTVENENRVRSRFLVTAIEVDL